MSLMLFLVVLGGIAHLWTLKAEPVFARLTKKAEDLMFANEDKTIPLTKSVESASPRSKLKTDIV